MQIASGLIDLLSLFSNFGSYANWSTASQSNKNCWNCSKLIYEHQIDIGAIRTTMRKRHRNIP